MAIERVRVRSAGPALFVDLVVAVSRTLPLDRVAAIKAALAQAIHAEMPEADRKLAVELWAEVDKLYDKLNPPLNIPGLPEK